MSVQSKALGVIVTHARTLANEKVKINCKYEADPRNGVVRNLQNGRDQRLRRVLVAHM